MERRGNLTYEMLTLHDPKIAQWADTAIKFKQQMPCRAKTDVLLWWPLDGGTVSAPCLVTDHLCRSFFTF